MARENYIAYTFVLAENKLHGYGKRKLHGIHFRIGYDS